MTERWRSQKNLQEYVLLKLMADGMSRSDAWDVGRIVNLDDSFADVDWSKYYDEFSKSYLDLLYNCVKAVALSWIGKNKPNAIYRTLFEK